MKKKKKRRSNSRDAIALEICRCDIHLVVCQCNDEDVNIHTQTLRWRHEASSLNSPQGAEELRAAIKTLVDENNLENESIHVVLSGDYCVTRVVSGTEERVDRELDNLEDRSMLYLSLGPGQKALGGAIRQIDARHQHALLSVVNQKTIDLLVDICESLHIEFELVEPSLSALARFMGKSGADADGPTLVINALHTGVEVGICHNGQLLLDYRPTGVVDALEIAKTVNRHLGRLQRYCDRYVRFTDGRLERLYLAGPQERVQDLMAAFQNQRVLSPSLISPKDSVENWTFQADDVPSYFAPSLGAVIFDLPGNDETAEAPNLLEQLDSQMIGPLIPASLRAFWPIAAAIVLVVFAWFGVAKVQDRCTALELELSGFLPDQQEAQKVGGDLDRDRKHLAIYESLSTGLLGPKWDQLTSIITQCLPDDAWLEEITVTSEGAVELKGNSYTESGVFRFRSWLRKYPGFSQVVLNETQAAQGSDFKTMESVAGSDEKFKTTTRFDIRCQLAGRADREESGDGDI